MHVLKPSYRIALLALLPISLGACQLLPTKASAPAEPVPPVLPFEQPLVDTPELDADLMYSYLVADIAAQRGELPLAYSHSLHVARVAHDPVAAERATRIAVYLQDFEGALVAARRWVALAPNNQDARMSLALLLNRLGDGPAALVELNALLKIADALQHDGFVQIAQVLAKEPSDTPLALMATVVAAHAEDPRAYYGLALVALSKREFLQAEMALRQGMLLQPVWPEAQVLLARARVGQGNKQAALAGLSSALDETSDSRMLRTARARLRVDMGDHDGALADFRRLSRLEPENAEYSYAVGMLAMQAKRWDEARDVWQRVRGLGGDRFSEATYFLAQVEEKTGHAQLASGLYASVDEGPLVVDAGLKLAELEAGDGQLDAARARLARLRRQAPDRAVDAYLTETRLLREAGQAVLAQQLMDQAVEQRPDDLSLRYARAMQAARAEDLQAMERDLRFILAQKPDHVDALNALGYTLADRNERLDEAEVLIQQALKLKPDSAAILDSMGWLRYRQGRLSEALIYLRQAYDAHPDPEIAAHLGEVLWVNGEPSAAMAVWQKTLKREPESEVLRAVMQRFQ